MVLHLLRRILKKHTDRPQQYPLVTPLQSTASAPLQGKSEGPGCKQPVLTKKVGLLWSNALLLVVRHPRQIPIELKFVQFFLSPYSLLDAMPPSRTNLSSIRNKMKREEVYQRQKR